MAKAKPFRIPARTLRSNAKAIEEFVKRMEGQRAPFGGFSIKTTDWPEMIGNLELRGPVRIRTDLKVRYAVMPARAVTDPRLGLTAFRVLAAIGLYVDRNGVAFPGMRALGKHLQRTKSTVCRGVAQLHALGYLRRLQPIGKRYPGAPRLTSRYQVLATESDPLPKGETELRA